MKKIKLITAIVMIQVICIGQIIYEPNDQPTINSATDDSFTIPATPSSIESYAIVVSNSDLGDPDWEEVVENLEIKHDGFTISYDGSDLWSVQTSLSDIEPKYICFVASPEHIISYGSEQYVRDIYQLTRVLDNDIYGDAIWGIITGFNAEDAKRIVSGPPALNISSALLKTAGGWLDYFVEGTYFSEGDYNVMWYKEPDGPVIKTEPGPTDCTNILCVLLNVFETDIMITSGHASQYDWQLHYPTAGMEGFFKSSPSGQLYGDPYSGDNININSTNPKVYYAPGNCLIGHIPGTNSMVLSWLHTGGAYQYCGYTVETSYGYAGWGVSEYFIKLKDRFSFAESIYLNNQALLFDLENSTPGTNHSGLNHDKDVLAFYGDPACDARLVNTTTIEPLYAQELLISNLNPDLDTVTFKIKMNKAGHPGRHPFSLFPFKAENTQILFTNANDAVVSDNFAMLNIWEEGNPDLMAGEQREVVFTIKKLTSVDKDYHKIPKRLSLSQNYPNPFSNQTTIEFTLHDAGVISLSIYDITGKRLETILSKKLPKGDHKINWNAKGLNEGIYFIRLETRNSSVVCKALITNNN